VVVLFGSTGSGCIGSKRTVPLLPPVTFPYAAQVCQIHRITYNLDGDLMREEIVYGITSFLSESKADAQRLLNLNRGHWSIENRLHWGSRCHF